MRKCMRRWTLEKDWFEILLKGIYTSPSQNKENRNREGLDTSLDWHGF